MEDFAGALSRVREWAQANDVALTDLSRILTGLQASASGDGAIADTGQHPTYGVPGLRSKPFWSKDDIRWWDSVQSSWEIVWREFQLVRDDRGDSGVDAGSRDAETGGFLFAKGNWDTVQLVHRGVRQETASRFPRTMAVLERTPGGASCGMTFFSTLRPGAVIRPHTGFTNTHLRAHLVLKQADGARFRVGREWVRWSEGDLLVFDDTYEHEAIADDTDERVVLLFDIWHPDLTAVEVRAVAESLDFLRRADNRRNVLERFASG